MAARKAHLLSGGRIRLLHSGRLEPIKGAQDIVPLAAALKRAGVDFELSIFGTGTLETAIREGIRREGLADHVTLHGVVDFETALVPFARTGADIFLSCHRQSDPSCTYLESMGCGLPIMGYSNRMWSALAAHSRAGWVAPLGDVDALARLITDISGRRDEIAAKSEAALAFALEHLFEAEFSRRIADLAEAPV